MDNTNANTMQRFLESSPFYLNDLANTSVIQILEALYYIHIAGSAQSGISTFTSRLLSEYRKKATSISNIDPKSINTKSKLFNRFRTAADLQTIIKCFKYIQKVLADSDSEEDFPLHRMKKERKKAEVDFEEIGNIQDHFEKILRAILDSLEISEEMKKELENLQMLEQRVFAARLSRIFADALLHLGPPVFSETISNLYGLYQIVNT